METKEIGLEIVQIRLIQDRIVYNEKPIHSPQDAVEILGNEIKDYDREVLCVLNLDAHGVVQNANIVSMGTVNRPFLLQEKFLRVRSYPMHIPSF